MTDAEQRSPEWYAARKGLVTASNVGAILGFDPWRTADDVMRAMVRDHFGADREFDGNPATAWGEANEAGAITDYTMETGRPTRPAPFVVSPLHPWLGASPDRYVSNAGLLEVKCPFKFRDTVKPVPFVPITDRAQRHYHAQIQVQMLCTGTEWCDFWQWAPADWSCERVDRDEQFLEWAIPELYGFYQRFLEVVGDPDKAAEHLAPKIATVDNARARQMVAEYRDLKEAEDRAAERAKELLAAIVQVAGGQTCFFGGAKLTQVEKAGPVKYAEVVKKHLPSLNLDPFRGKPSSYWMLK